MKKIILSLSALFTIGVASAQSYIKQPDPTTYNVVQYKATKKVEPAATAVKTETTTATPATTTVPAATTAKTTKVAAAAPRQERARVEDFNADTTVDKTKAMGTTDKKVATKDK
jgi:hypothetical protein